jgi:hypothetical protein
VTAFTTRKLLRARDATARVRPAARVDAWLALTTFANTFGVSVEFVHGELACLVVADRLPCTIDRAHGVV